MINNKKEISKKKKKKFSWVNKWVYYQLKISLKKKKKMIII